MKLKGKYALITGANQGFGFAVAKAFVQEGASVALCARNEKLLQKAQQELLTFAHKSAKILVMAIDITNPKAVKEFTEKTVQKFGKIDIVVANAGIYGPKGPVDENNWEEWSQAIDINLKGTVLSCKAVLPYFKKQKSGKIILLSGGGATKPLPYLSAYAASKAAVVRFGETIAMELAEYNVQVNSVAPGALNTRLLDEVLSAGPQKVGQAFYAHSLKQKEQGGAPLEKGANLCVYLASSESDNITGKLISAIWDPWITLNERINDLKETDIYTLRRIVPEERGKNWGNVE